MTKPQPVLNKGLLSAAANGEAETARQMLQLGADPDARTEWGAPAIVLAADGGHLGIVKDLIAAGADVDAQREGGETALMTATIHGKPEIVKTLLAARADTEAVNHWKKTALHLAVIYDDLVTGRLLLDAGASLGARDADGFTPKDLAEKNRLKNFLKLIGEVEEQRFDKDIEGFNGGLDRNVEVTRPVRVKRHKGPRPR